MSQVDVHMNMNTIVRFKLNEYGREKAQHLAHAERLKFKLKFTRQFKTDADGFSQLTFWEFANFFGPEFYHGSPSMFEGNWVTLQASTI